MKRITNTLCRAFAVLCAASLTATGGEDAPDSEDSPAQARELSGGTPAQPEVNIWEAALRGNAKAMQQHLAAGTGLDVKASDQEVTPLHIASFFAHEEIVKMLLEAGAGVNEINRNQQTPVETVELEWSPELEELYKSLGEELKIEIDLERIRKTRPQVAAILRKKSGPKSPGKAGPAPTAFRGSYFKNGEIHVNTYGNPEGQPLTSGHQDFKPSWSKTGDMLVFFRRLKDDPVVTNWITQICVIKVDGSGFHTLTDGTHTDFNQTWTRDGTNTPIWNRKHPDRKSFQVMASKVGAKPGEEIALTGKSYHTWAYTCLKDGRILVSSAHPKHGRGYFLMTPIPGKEPRFERIDCELAEKGILDRVSISPSETKVCFEYQEGFEYKDTGRTLYLADFDAEKRRISNPEPFANAEGKNRWFAYPRWTKDESAIVYHASPSLYLYTLEDSSTIKVSTDPKADYRYPHCEATPK